jgi:hypothetical protein
MQEGEEMKKIWYRIVRIFKPTPVVDCRVLYDDFRQRKVVLPEDVLVQHDNHWKERD